MTAVRDGGRIRGSDAEVWNRFFHVWTFGIAITLDTYSHAIPAMQEDAAAKIAALLDG